MKQKFVQKVWKLCENKRAFNVYLFTCCILSGVTNTLKAVWAVKRLKKGKKVLAIMLLIDIPINIALEIQACVRAAKAQEKYLINKKTNDALDELLNGL